MVYKWPFFNSCNSYVKLPETKANFVNLRFLFPSKMAQKYKAHGGLVHWKIINKYL